MSPRKPAFHVRQDATPVRVEGVLRATTQADGPLSYAAIYDMTNDLGYDLNNRYEPIVLLKDLNVLERKSCLPTRLGQELQDLLLTKHSAFSEVMHVLQYAAWQPTDPTTNCFSWSYRQVCDQLWEAESTTVDRKQLVSEVSDMAMSYFDTMSVSFGPNSIDGILHWLRVLNPPVITTVDSSAPVLNVFTRRTFCPPETFVLAVDFVYRMEDADYQTNLLLDPDKQAAICKVCLLEPTAFDPAFDWAAGQYDFLQRGTSGGWGSYVLLTRQPQIQDFRG